MSTSPAETRYDSGDCDQKHAGATVTAEEARSVREPTGGAGGRRGTPGGSAVSTAVLQVWWYCGTVGRWDQGGTVGRWDGGTVVRWHSTVRWSRGERVVQQCQNSGRLVWEESMSAGLGAARGCHAGCSSQRLHEKCRSHPDRSGPTPGLAESARRRLWRSAIRTRTKGKLLRSAACMIREGQRVSGALGGRGGL